MLNNVYANWVVSCALLCLAMILCGVAGHRAGRRRLQRNPTADDASTGAIDAAIFSLLGLLIAFTFSNAYSRYDHRRQLLIDEINAIGTAYLRVDLLPVDSQAAMRMKFADYVTSRSQFWQRLSDRDRASVEYARAQDLQQAIWSDAVESTQHETQGDARKLLLPALNEMIDITTTRLVAVQSHPPVVVFLLLGALSLAAAYIAGFNMARNDQVSYMHLGGLAFAVAVTLIVILDIEYLRHGLVTLDAPHELLTELSRQLRDRAK